MEKEIPDFYPMPMFVKLEVADLARATAWYEEALGFRSVYAMEGMAHVRGARYQDLMLLAGGAPDGPRGRGMTINFAAEPEALDALARRASLAGEDVEGPILRPWNARELVVRDLDGYVLTFSAPVDTNRSFDDVMKDVQA
ncbi:glyoxalase [Paenibacillus sp. J31TS4]|uniref:VOC family protein n=1 Tax=Paenibacillus sp. J31TS4 TaxID=2807195 RepID=UPI001AFDE9F7|nr:VOC family protein [Paenibacillus sp. J31TS4]GIP40506.1 glyoxalase [Paenibacillus sp. J31TS4]